MKLRASATAFEALPPPIWSSVKVAIQEVARDWGVEIAIEDDLTIPEAYQRFFQLNRIYEDAQLAKPEDV